MRVIMLREERKTALLLFDDPFYANCHGCNFAFYFIFI